MNHDDLRSGTPYWRAIGQPVDSYPVLKEDVTCDVAIVGGGITGVLVARQLHREGVHVVVVDREDFATGSTIASTGLLQYEVDTPLTELIDKVGREHAVRSYSRGLEAIEDIAAIAAELGDSVGFARRNSLYLASTPADLPGLRGEYECRRHFGFDVQFLESDMLKTLCGIVAPGAIWSSGDGEIDPYRFTQSLLRNITGRGVRAFSHTSVESVDESPASVRLLTNRGEITARSVIFATGYTAHEHLRQYIGTLHTTYVAVSEPGLLPAKWPERSLLWETARPYSYARTLDDGRILIGGEDTAGPFDHEDDSLLARKTKRLAERLSVIYPEVTFKSEFTWGGTFSETRDGLPYIGAAPGHQRIYFALGYGGNGITFSMLAARLLTDLFVGKPNADAAMFRFDR